MDCDYLMHAILAKIRCYQSFFRCIPGISPAAEVEKQPTEIQCRDDLVERGAEETVGSDILGCRKGLTLVTAKRRQCEYREVFAFDIFNFNRDLALRFSRNAYLWICAL